MEFMFNEAVINKIRGVLVAKGQTLAAAESVTSGLLQSAFASAQNASLFFQGGISAYNIGQKARHLQVEPIHAIANNCVSQKVAEQMALNVCPMFHSDWGVAITGYAAPVPESGNKVFAYYAIALNGRILKKGKLTIKKGSPQKIQLFYVEEILKNLNNVLFKK